jgi:putative hemolysin
METFLTIILPGIAVAILVGVVAFFASSETAYLSITKMTLKQLLKNDDPTKKSTPAKKIAFLKKDTEKLLSLILIGINFVTSLASGVATAIAIKIAGEMGSAYATAVMVFVLIIFGEITPKTFAAVYPVKAASLFATPLIILQKIFFPIVWIFAKIASFFTMTLNALWKDDKNEITEEELKSLIEVGENEGTLEHSEKKMLYKIFDFTDLRAHDIMRHRSLVKFVPEDATYEEVVKIFSETGFSRLPVCTEGGFDNVVGMIYYKNLLIKSRYKNSDKFIKKCMRPVVFVPETLLATELLARFKKEQVNFAIAVDETGSNSGIITMDDIMRAVFGRSIHEDSSELPPEARIQSISPYEYLVPGDMKIDDVNELLSLDLFSEDYETLAGWLLEQFDALPEAGESITRDNTAFIVEEQNQRRIQSVRIQFARPNSARQLNKAERTS